MATINESTVMRIVSLCTQAPFVTVHTNTYTPAVFSPLTLEAGLVVFAITAELVVVHTPFAGVGFLPLSAVVEPCHIC